MPKTDLAQIIRDEITRRGLSQYRISLDTHVPQSTLSDFLSGGSGLKLTHASELLDYLGFEVRRTERRKKREERSD